MKSHGRSDPEARPAPRRHPAMGALGAPWELVAGVSRKTYLLLGLILAIYAIDFCLDVGHRDALSWMDPYQYYNFALDVHEGVRNFNQFELPSIFPFFLLPFVGIRSSIPSALGANLVFALVLVAATLALCRSLRIKTPVMVVACALLSSPLLLGLSRSLYMEFALSAVVAVQYALWLGRPELDRTRDLLAFALVLAVGLLMKMTYPLFIIVPAILTGWVHLRQRRRAAAMRLLLALLVPAGAVLAIEYLVFNASFAYYISLGNTRIPIMHLIGPAKPFSFESATFYPEHIGKTLLYLLTPFLIVPIALAVSAGRRAGRRLPPADLRMLILWAWFLTPLLLLIPQAVKEPRHVAPCVLPGVLLIFQGLARVDSRRLRTGLTAGVLVLSLGQYILCTWHVRPVPYFLDQPSHADELEEAMVQNDRQRGIAVGAAGSPGRLRWLYSQNIAISTPDANMALLLTWRFNPAVCYDVDLIPPREPAGQAWAYHSFEDLYYLAAFNTYNRRCLYGRYDFTLDRQTVVANADYVIVAEVDDSRLTSLWPQYARIMSLGDGRHRIHLLARRGGSGLSYRRLYAREFLTRGRPSEAADLAAIYFDMAMDAMLRGDRQGLEEILAEFPPERFSAGEVRNIYWTGTMASLRSATRTMLSEYLRSRAKDAAR
jgi:hypothetical protein